MTAMNRGSATPPKTISAQDMLAKMRAGIKEVSEISLREFRIPVRVLAADEVNTIRREAILNTAKIGGDEADTNFYSQKRILINAAQIVPGQPGLLTDKLIALMSVDEINYLYNEYIRVMQEADPNLEIMEPEQFRALVDAVKKNSVTSKDLSLLQLKAIFTAFQDLIKKQESHASPKGK